MIGEGALDPKVAGRLGNLRHVYLPNPLILQSLCIPIFWDCDRAIRIIGPESPEFSCSGVHGIQSVRSDGQLLCFFLERIGSTEPLLETYWENLLPNLLVDSMNPGAASLPTKGAK